RQTVDIIASTLDELGFSANPQIGGPPVVDKIGASTRILARRQEQDAITGELRDERQVIFHVDSDGSITYDFSGYIGEDVTSQSQRVFAALRAKGIVIVDSATEQKLKNLSSEEIMSKLLNDSEITLHFDFNRRKA